jgi:Holliday junction resolvase RusA-like endonuclease
VSIIEFEIAGHPTTQGSKRSHTPTYANGEPVRRHRAGCPDRYARERATCACPILTTVREQMGEALTNWRHVIATRAREAMAGRPLLDGLIEATFVFEKPRPKSHYGTGRNAGILKDSAPAAPGKRPDGLKLARAVEDALTGVVYTDDSLIVTHLLGKRYCDRLAGERVLVRFRLLDTQTVGDLVTLGILELPRPGDEEQLDLLALAS